MALKSDSSITLLLELGFNVVLSSPEVEDLSEDLERQEPGIRKRLFNLLTEGCLGQSPGVDIFESILIFRVDYSWWRLEDELFTQDAVVHCPVYHIITQFTTLKF